MAIMAFYQKETFSRFITAIILLPLLWVLIMGGIPAMILALGFVLFMSGELLISVTNGRINGRFLCALTATGLPALVAFLGIELGWQSSALAMMQTLAWSALVIGGIFVFRHISGIIMLLGLSLLGWSLVQLLSLADGGIWLALCLVTVAVVDTMGYLAGRKLGGPKLCPAISPAKTWSGAIAGIIFSPLPLLAYHLWCDKPLLPVWFALGIGVISILGDLMESWFKRCHHIKDIGHILPGHGGLLDRFDGSVLAVPLLYALLVMGWMI